MTQLPDEITMIILSNLPVKSLLRFRCVSKSWQCSISCPNFQLSNQRRERAIARVYPSLTWSSKPSFRLINQQLTLEELNHPLSHHDEIYIQTCMILGSCHGLILFNENEHIYLWNSAIRICTKVLELDRLNEVDYYTRGGLCFDSSTNVYKAVLIMEYETLNYGGELVILASLEDKQWRQLEFPYDIHSMSEGITFQGRLHYRVKVKRFDNNENNKFRKSLLERVAFNQVIYFDPTFEKFHMFPIPEPKYNQKENAIVGLGVLYEYLCMTRLEGAKGGVEILVMKEYGVKKSWTSLFFIKNLFLNSSYCGFVVPFSVTETGELIALITYYRDQKILIYNPKNDNMREIPVVFEGQMEYSCGPMVTYVESLISPEKYYWNEKRQTIWRALKEKYYFYFSS